MLDHPFIKRVISHLPKNRINHYNFSSWSAGNPTNEGVGFLPATKISKEQIISLIMDVNHYVGNIAYVTECYKINDSKHNTSDCVHFYQRIKVPLVGDMHHELVIEHIGAHQGYELVAWRMLEAETAALSKAEGIRSQYNEGCWLVGDDVVGYALSSAPLRADLGFIKWKALTKGADVAASKLVRENIEGMLRWAARAS